MRGAKHNEKKHDEDRRGNLEEYPWSISADSCGDRDAGGNGIS